MRSSEVDEIFKGRIEKMRELAAEQSRLAAEVIAKRESRINRQKTKGGASRFKAAANAVCLVLRRAQQF